MSSVIKGGGDVTLSAGQNLQMVASQVNAGNEAYLVSGKNLDLKSAENQDYSFYSKTKKTSQGKKFRLDETDVVNNVGSLVSAGKNSTVVAGENLLLAGSAVTAEKGATQLAAGQDLSILAVSNADSARHERKESKSSWGGLKSSKVQDKVDEKRTTAMGSMVSGETVTVAAKRDATVTGSSLVSTGDLAVQAGRDLTIDAAQNTFARTDMHKEKNRDLTGVLTGNKLGLDDMTGNQKLYINSSKHNGTANEMTLTGSTIGSSAGNVSLTAGRELKVVASDLVSTKNMELSGANVTVTSGMETASQTSKDSSKSLAVGRVIAGSVVDTATSMRDAVKAARSADDPRLKAVKIAQAALAAYNLNGQASDANAQSSGFKNKTGGTPGNGSLIKIGTELANNRSKNSSEYNSATAKQSTLNAGQDLSIVATGAAAGTQGDIQITGSRLKAANTLLLAKNDVLMQSAQNTTDRKNEGSKNKTAIGASFNIGEQNGFTLDLGAQGAKNNGNGNSVTQVNSTLDTGSLLLQSGGDTTLKGAQVRANRIKADIGGNLNIISLQDTESSRSKQSSAGFGASICVPPFCYGSTVAGSANLAAANMNSDYKGVTDQSGLYAGTGGYDINVGKNTTLQGAVIASEASADKNRLSTDRLIVSDIKNVSEIKSQSAGISMSSSSTSGASMGGSIPIALKEKDHSYTRSAVSEGTIVVRSAEGANDLVGLNRDTANANQKLDRPDEKAMQECIDLIQSSAQLASGLISAVGKAKADEAKALADKAKTQTEAGSPDAAGTVLAANAAYAEAKRWHVGGDKKLMADIATGLIAAGLGGAPVGTTVGIVANTASSDIFNKIGDYAHSRATDPKADAATRAAWAEGGAARVMLHALAGAAMGLSSGSVQSGALGAGASAALTPIVTDALKNTIVERQNRDAISVLIATGIGAGAGSGAGLSGAAVGGNSAAKVEMFNRQMHPAEVMALKTQVNALAAEARITTAEAEQRLARGLVYYVDATWNKVVGAHQDQPDPLTLKYLGIALAPLGDSYSKRVDMGDVPVIAGAKKTYTPDETVRLLQDYRVNNSGSYNKSEINEEYLVGKLDPVVNHQHDFYQKNLGYNSSLGALLEGAGTGIPQGLGEGAANTARGVWALGTGLVTDFPGVSSRMANGLVAFVSGRGPEADIHDEAQGFLYLLQGDEVARARLAAKSSAEFALAMIPAGRAGAVGKAVELAADAKGPATTLLSGETKLVGSSAPAANDASFMGPFVPQLSRYEDRIKLTPINGGSWSGLRGESNFVFDNPELKTILPDGISYKNGYPDFSPVAVQEIRLPGLITTNRDSNFRAANKMLASQLGIKEADVVRFVREQKYTWHEVEDMRTLQLVPSFIHTGKVGPMGFGVKYGHLGGIAERSLLEALKK
ncbi:hemagglutinin repeat-containing protein [Pseudomonas sp. FP2309]|uniref:hemagglutinin repeat-containing protein n=1 Tax=Pseudomonas sp. FP2309 TaxID=2954091 RepID=UPI002733894C|nr:hemagglutinin repeat-containing protein [Pseudomonas sp. FP2309]WLH68687.1 hemagglutinin repeat-containing protein [Pseudomonas sp. FP2309]